ncbi:MAG: aminopeptidase P family protein [Gemmatimonadaceae bacterium]|nr:aminopeptidase P family protein [Gemmatimonadaceae bacterium]
MRRSPLLIAAIALLTVAPLGAQSHLEARNRWARLCEIRRDKFDRILPEAMRENGIDMWIVAMREGHHDPLWELLGRGYVGTVGYLIFTDRGGDRIERVAVDITDHQRAACGAYDVDTSSVDLAAFVRQRNPKRIGVNTSTEMGMADGLSHTLHQHLVTTLGPALAAKMVSAEKLVSDFSSRRVASELVAFGEATEFGRQLAERALSNEVITPGVTTLADVAWWVQEQQRVRGLGSSFEVPSIYITGPNGIEATSNDRIIQRGDILMMDFGVGYLNMWTDQKRIAYVLKPGETALPASMQRAFDQAVRVREVIRRTARAGKTAQAMMDEVNAAIVAAGFTAMRGFNQVRADSSTEFIIGCHSVGDWGHGIGPSMAFFNPGRLTFEIRPTNLFSIELFAYTPIPEWGGKKLRIPLEDDAVITARGVEWLTDQSSDPVDPLTAQVSQPCLVALRASTTRPIPIASTSPWNPTATAPMEPIGSAMRANDASCPMMPRSETISAGRAQLFRRIRPSDPTAPSQTAIAVMATDHAGRAA